MSTYNADPNVNTLAAAVIQSPDARGKVYSRILEVGATTRDDFAKLEGAAGGPMPFWKRTDLTKFEGDRISFTTVGDASGPGARGEQELTGRTSKVNFGGLSVQVDIFRDAVELTDKQIRHMAVGKSLESTVLSMLAKKMGRKRMYDMMHALLRTENAILLRPNGKGSDDEIRHTDSLGTSFVVESKARLQGIGGQPISSGKMSSGATINRYLAFITADAMTDIRTASGFTNSMLQAAERGNKNPIFTGDLPDWQGMKFWEHQVVDADCYDTIGSPMLPKAKLGVAVTAGTTTFEVKGHATDTLCEYFRDFPGFDYKFTEDQNADPDSGTYYFWIINTSGADVGKGCFYSYLGTDNLGNKIDEIQLRLGASDSGIRNDTVGNVTYASVNDQGKFSAVHPVGSWIIPANKYGVPIGSNFIFGAGAALRAYGSISSMPIKQMRDYEMIKGRGYAGIWGQRARLDTQDVPRNYVILKSAVEHPGITVPYFTT